MRAAERDKRKLLREKQGSSSDKFFSEELPGQTSLLGGVAGSNFSELTRQLACPDVRPRESEQARESARARARAHERASEQARERRHSRRNGDALGHVLGHDINIVFELRGNGDDGRLLGDSAFNESFDVRQRGREQERETERERERGGRGRGRERERARTRTSERARETVPSMKALMSSNCCSAACSLTKSILFWRMMMFWSFMISTAAKCLQQQPSALCQCLSRQISSKACS